MRHHPPPITLTVLKTDHGRCSWIYGKHFMQRVQYQQPVEILGVLQDFVQCDWSDAPSRLKQTISLHSVINISAAPALEMTSLTYKDGGALSKCSDIFSHQAPPDYDPYDRSGTVACRSSLRRTVQGACMELGTR